MFVCRSLMPKTAHHKGIPQRIQALFETAAFSISIWLQIKQKAAICHAGILCPYSALHGVVYVVMDYMR